MPAENPYTVGELQVLAAHYQEYDKNLTGVQFRNNWVFQEDFYEYYMIHQTPQKFVYVTLIDDSFHISKRSIDEMTLDWNNDTMHKFRPLLKWEPNVRPDGQEYYEHHCLACGEGIQSEYNECMACGFMKSMLYREENDDVLEEYRQVLMDDILF